MIQVKSHRRGRAIVRAYKRGSQFARRARAQGAREQFYKAFNAKYPHGHYTVPHKRRAELQRRLHVITTHDLQAQGRIYESMQKTRTKKRHMRLNRLEGGL